MQESRERYIGEYLHTPLSDTVGQGWRRGELACHRAAPQPPTSLSLRAHRSITSRGLTSTHNNSLLRYILHTHLTAYTCQHTLISCKLQVNVTLRDPKWLVYYSTYVIKFFFDNLPTFQDETLHDYNFLLILYGIWRLGQLHLCKNNEFNIIIIHPFF